jgi:hypothetical protein
LQPVVVVAVDTKQQDPPGDQVVVVAHIDRRVIMQVVSA